MLLATSTSRAFLRATDDDLRDALSQTYQLLLLQLLKGVSAKDVDSHMFQVPELLSLQ